jgi:drug/metabolite transporter (DMT)-like permease
VSIDPARRSAPRTLGLLAVGGAVLCFSVSSSIVKWAGVPGSVIAFWRMLAAIVVWWVIAHAAGHPPTMASLRRAGAAGALFGVNLACFFTAVTMTSIAHAEFLGALTPLVLLPAGALWYAEPIEWRALGWGAAAIVGVAIVLFGGSDSGTASARGDLLVVVAMLLWASYLLVTKRVRQGMHVSELMASVTPIGTLALVPIVLVRGGVTEMTAKGWVAVLLLLGLTGVGAHGLVVFAQRHVPVATIGVLQVAQPALAVVWAFWILGETIRPIQTVGMALVVIGLAAFTVVSNRAATASLRRTTDGELAGPAG